MLRSPAFWAWLSLACLPPDLLAWAFGWDSLQPASVLVSLAWWPLDVLGRLAALRMLLDAPGGAWPAAPSQSPSLARAWASAQSAELRVGLWSSVWALAGLVPALLAFSLGGWGLPWGRGLLILLALLGLVPALLYVLRRWLAVFFVLRGQGAGAALESSRDRLRGKMGPFIRAFLPWLLAAWALDGAGWLLPGPWGLPLEPLSTALELLGLWKGAQAL
ncbi:MAG TPA: hypothetical protein VK842_10475 [bacterium]|nr:hypothetical protein [bacterium]